VSGRPLRTCPSAKVSPIRPLTALRTGYGLRAAAIRPRSLRRRAAHIGYQVHAASERGPAAVGLSGQRPLCYAYVAEAKIFQQQ
jgi:hypothetical protein